MSETCKVCGCELSCPICADANAGLVDDIDRLQQERDNLARALFRIRSLTMRGRGDAHSSRWPPLCWASSWIADIACEAVRSIDETPLFEPEMSSGEESELIDQHLREG